MKINKHIVVVRSTVPRYSSISEKSCACILAVLSKHYKRVGVSIINCLADLETLAASKPDLIFLGMKVLPTTPDEKIDHPSKIGVGEYLEARGITCTGSPQAAIVLEQNKPLAKQSLSDFGLRTSPYFVVKQDTSIKIEDVNLTYPLFVKPANRGGGLGIDINSVVNNLAELQSKIEDISTRIKSDSLVEQFLTGREISVAILKQEGSEEYLVMPIEKIPPLDERNNRILSGSIKSADSVEDRSLADGQLRDDIKKLAIEAFGALGARDFGRIDIRLDKNNVPNFLEANLMPSLLAGYGSFPKACKMNYNLEFEPMILQITNLAFARTI